MKSHTPKTFGEGQLGNSKGTLCTIAAGARAYIKFFNLYNQNAATQTILTYINISGTSRFWRRFELEQNESADVLDEGQSLQLPAGALIEAQTTTAAAVDYVITGIEETET